MALVVISEGVMAINYFVLVLRSRTLVSIKTQRTKPWQKWKLGIMTGQGRRVEERGFNYPRILPSR